MEMFDLVNEQDEVIGTTDKVEAHARNLIHRVAAVFVFNAEGELYVQCHKKSGKFDHSVGGHVSQGESYGEAAAREAQEEIGITQPLQFVSKFYSDEGDMRHMFGIYECVAEDTWNFVPNDEVEEIFPMPLDDIRQQMNKQPELYTGGFLNTMVEFCRAKQIS